MLAAAGAPSRAATTGTSSAESALVPTLSTLVSTEQIRTTAQQTPSVSFERQLAGISAEVNVSTNSEAVKEWTSHSQGNAWKRLLG